MTIARFEVPAQPDDETARQAALDACELRRDPEPAFDAIARDAAQALDVPIGLVNIIDGRTQWPKAAFGVEAGPSPRNVTFCAHTINEDDALIIPDSHDNPRFAGNPNVLGGLKVRFYAGAPITLSSGHKVGVLCVLDSEPHPAPTPQALDRLRGLADEAAKLIEGTDGPL